MSSQQCSADEEQVKKPQDAAVALKKQGSADEEHVKTPQDVAVPWTKQCSADEEEVKIARKAAFEKQVSIAECSAKASDDDDDDDDEEENQVKAPQEAPKPTRRKSIFAPMKRSNTKEFTSQEHSRRRRASENDMVPIIISDEDARCFYDEAITAVDSPEMIGHRGSMIADQGALRLEHLEYMIEEYGLSDFGSEECQRLYESIPADPNGVVWMEEFVQAVHVNTSLRSLLIARRIDLDSGFHIPDKYDYSKSTVDNYKTTDATKFTGPFKDIRRRLDYSYHSNLSPERQAWQDAIIQKIIWRTNSQAAPWLVFTCGPMGVGKGYALNWMSRQGHFPLESIVHVDPDGFKTKMPEWPHYVATNQTGAGTLCHRESTMMMEIAQQAAMRSRQNVWVDGSLRDADYYQGEFREIRESHPHYRIAIFYVTAKEETIRARIKRRSEETGRAVPEELIVASLKAMDRSLNTLTPLCDFVARIDNNDGHTPRLMAFEQVDTSGSWAAISNQFAKQQATESEFPNALAPFKLSSMEAEYVDMLDASKLSKQRLTVKISSSKICPSSLKAMFNDTDVEMVMSQISPLTLPEKGRRILRIPDEAKTYAFVYALADRKTFYERDYIAHGCTQEQLRLPLVHLLRRGAFVYFGTDNYLTAVSIITNMRTDAAQSFMGFGPRSDVPLAVAEAIPADLFQPTPVCYWEASRFAWIPPRTMSANVEIGGKHGCFLFHVNDAYYAFEPLVS